VNHDGYLRLKFNGKGYMVHRVAWFIMTGRWPVEIDHKNGDPFDNRWKNLRESNRSDNNANRAARGSSGLLGVSWNAEKQKWVAQARWRGKKLYFGQYDDKREASKAYRDGVTRIRGEYPAGGREAVS